MVCLGPLEGYKISGGCKSQQFYSFLMAGGHLIEITQDMDQVGLGCSLTLSFTQLLNLTYHFSFLIYKMAVTIRVAMMIRRMMFVCVRCTKDSFPSFPAVPSFSSLPLFSAFVISKAMTTLLEPGDEQHEQVGKGGRREKEFFAICPNTPFRGVDHPMGFCAGSVPEPRRT